ncbi:MAG: benzoate-CoA ligase family protein [Candidatus Acidiferrales bacterium]
MALEIPERFNIASWFVDRPAGEHPGRIAILGEPYAVSYRELQELTNRTGNALRKLGCQAGDRVLIILPDSVEFIAAFFGAAKIGAVAVPVNPLAKSADLNFYQSNCGARFAVLHVSVLPELLQAPGAIETKWIVVGDSAPELIKEKCRIDWENWNEWIRAASPDLEANPTSAHDTAFLLHTSGSSGRPKAVVHQHKDMYATSRCFAREVLGTRSEDRTFSVSKLFFAYGLGNAMYFPLSVGASTILNPERTKVEKVAALIAKHRPTIFFAVPTFFAALLHDSAAGLPVDLSSVRLVVSAGEPLPEEIFTQFKDRFGLEILDGIGSTEMLQTFISNRPGEVRPGSCGLPVSGYEAQIVDENGEPVPGGDIGTLCVKGESAFAGYWNQPEMTARAKVGKWVITGDKFFQDADGYFYYYGRADDMMKVSGMWVSPAEVENALLGHQDVSEAAVVGVSDAAGLLKTVAFVVLREGNYSSERITGEIQEFVRKRLAPYKCPRQVRIVAELPKTATGKIQRFLLRDKFRKERSESA